MEYKLDWMMAEMLAAVMVVQMVLKKGRKMVGKMVDETDMRLVDSWAEMMVGLKAYLTDVMTADLTAE